MAGGRGGAEPGIDHGPRGLAVQGDPHRVGYRPVDGGGDQRVDELQGAAAGEDARGPQPVRAVGGLLGAQAGHGGGQRGPDLGAEHGGGPGEADRGGAEPLQPGDQAAALHRGDQVAQQVDAATVGLQPPVTDLRGQLDCLERVSRGDRPALPAELLVGVRADPVAHQQADRVGGQRFQAERTVPGAARQAAERLGGRRQFVRAVGHHDEQREVVGAGCERGQPVQGLRVGPVRVVEHQHHRGVPDHHVGEHPVQSVAQPLGVGGGALRGAQPQRRAHDAVPTAQCRPQIRLGGAGQQRLQELPCDVEGDLLLLVAAARGQHGAAAVRGPGPYLGEQGRLAQPGGPGERQQPAPPP